MAEECPPQAVGEAGAKSPTLYDLLPLHDGRLSIRLLILLPGQPSDHIQCKLKVVVVSAVARYEALSYTWGEDLSRNKTITVNGQPFSITHNLDEALRGLRHTKKRRTIWADAICINQADIDERSAQVQEMGNIFQCAHRVLIWLGGGTAGTTLAIGYIKHCLAKTGLQPSLGPSVSYGNLYSGMVEISQRRWWNRVWVVQELARASSDPLVGCGHHWVSWSDLVSFIDQNGMTRHEELLEFRERVMEMQSMRQEVRLPPRLRDGDLDMEDDLFLWLRRTAMFESTDPRDKLIALLGLARSRLMSQLKINYSISAPELTSDLGIKFIQESQNLDLLAFCAPGASCPRYLNRYNREDPLRDVFRMIRTTWVPDLAAKPLPTLRPVATDFEQSHLSFRGDSLSKIPRRKDSLSSNLRRAESALKKWSEILGTIAASLPKETGSAVRLAERNILAAHGFCIGKVGRVLEDSDQSDWYFSKNLRQESGYEHPYHYTGCFPCRDWRPLEEKDRCFLQPKLRMTAIKDIEERRLRVRSERWCEQDTLRKQTVADGSKPATYTTLNILSILSRCEAGLSDARNFIQEGSRRKMLVRYWQPVWSGFVDLNTLEGGISKSVPKLNDSTAENHLKIVKAMHGRYQFLTDSGLIGIGPFDLEPGDLIVLFRASRYAFALRPLERDLFYDACPGDSFSEAKQTRFEHDCYTLVGQVFVNVAEAEAAWECEGFDQFAFADYEVNEEEFHIM